MHLQQNIRQHKTSKKILKPGLVASYNLWPENGTGLFWKKSISQEVNE